jgi:hypothetical protein
VFYRSREIDTAELAKIVEASIGSDFDAWNRGLMQKVMQSVETATK